MYFTLYGKSLTSRDVRDSQLQIVLPSATSHEEPVIDRTDSASGNKKKQKVKTQTKAEKIIEANKQRKMDKRIANEIDQVATVEDLLKQISFDDYSRAIDIIEESLLQFQTPINRLELLKRKFRFQRKYLQVLKKKENLTSEEQSKFDLLQIGYFATMTELAHLENIVDVFNEKKKYIEELVENSSLDRDKWYRFQLEKINSRIPRREQGLPDNRIPDFVPDKWQVDFLDAVDKQQSIIIVAPTASGQFTSFLILIH
jgi:superfamily II RNA helicase